MGVGCAEGGFVGGVEGWDGGVRGKVDGPCGRDRGGGSKGVGEESREGEVRDGGGVYGYFGRGGDEDADLVVFSLWI